MYEKIDNYLEDLPEARREALTKLRRLILETVPEAEELIAYNMPAVAVADEHVLCSYKSQKNYMSLYVDVDLLAKYEDQMAGLNCGKSCIRFKRFEQLPVTAVQAILRETAEKQKMT